MAAQTAPAIPERRNSRSPAFIRGGATAIDDAAIPNQHRGRSRRADRGYSLLELLLALALGLMLVAGLTRLFAGSGESYALLQSQARLQESGRYALQFLGRSVRGAGSLGCNARPLRIVNGLNGDLGDLFELDIRQAFAGFDDAGGGSLATFAGNAGINPNRMISGTDILTTRRVESPLRRVVADVDANGSPVVEAGDSFDLRRRDFALLSDCEQASLFRITRVRESAGRARLLREAGAGRYDNAPSRPLSPAGRSYGPARAGGGATVGRVLTETYFIARSRGTDGRGQPSRSLWRRSGTAAPAELVEGIHDLQVSFGVDTSPDDGVAGVNRHLGIDDVPPGAVIRSVQLSVSAGEPPDLRIFAQTFGVRVANAVPTAG